MTWAGADTEQRDHEYQQGQRGNRLQNAHRAKDDLAESPLPRGQDAERYGNQDRGRQ